MSLYQPSSLNPTLPGAWQPGLPTDSGLYWLYGYAHPTSTTPELRLAAAHKDRKGVMIAVNGVFLDRPGRTWFTPAAVPTTDTLLGSLPNDTLHLLNIAAQFRGTAQRAGDTWTYRHVQSFTHAALERAQALGLVEVQITGSTLTALKLTPAGAEHTNST